MGLVLASASPRRQELLRAAGIAITVQPTNIPETPKDGEAPKIFAERLAREKAWAIFKRTAHRLCAGSRYDRGGGPTDSGQAPESGRTRSECCAASGRNARSHDRGLPDGAETRRQSHDGQVGISLGETRCETTLVTMSQLSDEEIRAYVATGEPDGQGRRLCDSGHCVTLDSTH